jgi:hypothetical protein
VIDSLLETLVVQVGLADVRVGSHQLELSLAMCEHQDLSQSQLMHPDVQRLLLALALHELVQHLELLLQLFTDLVLDLPLPDHPSKSDTNRPIVGSCIPV